MNTIINRWERNISPQSGFTLLELLLVVAGIVILATTLIFTLNPLEVFEQIRDTERKRDLNNYYQTTLTNTDGLMDKLSTDFQEICDEDGQSQAGDDKCVDVQDKLVPDYMRELPRDPSLGGNNTGTGYYARLNPDDGNPEFYAPLAESRNVFVNIPEKYKADVVTHFEQDTSDPDLLLNTYPGAAAAYALRKLDKNYAGNAIRVRRSSDNSEQDIGFTASGDLDESALTTFTSTGDAFVATWYDQTGNGNDATQSTTGKQPQIISSGSIIMDNNKPAITFIDKELQTGSNFSHSGSTSMFAVVNLSESSPSLPHGLYQLGNVNEPTLLGVHLLKFRQRYTPTFADATKSFSNYGVQRLVSGLCASGTNIIRLNTVQGTNTSYTPTTVNNRSLWIGSLNGIYFWRGEIQELVFYTSDQSANLAGIESDINNYYNIY